MNDHALLADQRRMQKFLVYIAQIPKSRMHNKSLQIRCLEILEGHHAKDLWSRFSLIFITSLVLTNIVAVVLESVPWIQSRFATPLQWFEWVSVVIFTLEYLVRIWAHGARYKITAGGAWRGRKTYITSFYGLIDLAAILPFYLQIFLPGLDLRVLRIVRLVRALKLSHYSSAIEDLIYAIQGEKRSFIAALYLLLIVLLLFGSLMYFAEHTAQPDIFGSIPESLYWAAITLTTVGYGDVSPVTWTGQIIAVMTSFMGVCTVALLTGIVANAFANQLARRRAIFEAELRQALKDGELNEDEIARLEQMKKAFNLSDNMAQSILTTVELENKSDTPAAQSKTAS